MYFDEQKYLIWAKFIEPQSSMKKSNSRFSTKKDAPLVPLNCLTEESELDPSSLISKILAAKNPSELMAQESFLNLETHKISMLVPYIKLYKVDGEAYKPFLFPTYTYKKDIESMFTSSGRLSGAGIKSFTMKFQGKDTFTADKLIDCNLSFYVQNMKSFFETDNPAFAPLAELITIRKPPEFHNLSEDLRARLPNTSASQVVTSTDGLEIKADIGWAFYPEMRHYFTEAEIRGIENSRASLRLTLTNHSFNFSQEGTVEVNASYIGRLEALFDSKMSDLFLQQSVGAGQEPNYFKRAVDAAKAAEEKQVSKVPKQL